jgi:streptomycin 3"-adenylyltransferase
VSESGDVAAGPAAVPRGYAEQVRAAVPPGYAEQVTAAVPRGYAEQVTAAVARCSGGGGLAGSYLHGSAVLGGWVAGRSDVDILLVVGDDTDDRAVSAIGEVLAAEAVRCPGAGGLEVSVVAVSAAARPAAPWPFILHGSPGPEGLRLVDGRGHPGDADLIMHYAVVRDAGIAVAGPPPRECVGPVPRPEILQYLAGELDWGLAHGTESYAVLNACRALEYQDSGRIVSKVAGGAAALAQGKGPAGLIERALRQQRAEAPAQPPAQDAIEFVRDVVAQLVTASD